MNKKLKQILDRYPMLEADRNYIANLANNAGGNAIDDIVIIKCDDETYELLKELSPNLKTDVHISSTNTFVKIDKATAEAILDLHFIFLNSAARVCKYYIRVINDPYAQRIYIANGQYYTMPQTYEGDSNTGYAHYRIYSPENEYYINIYYVETESGANILGVEEIGWYIKLRDAN